MLENANAIPILGAFVCNHAECELPAEVIPVLVLRHKRNKEPSYVDINVPVCRAHLPTFEALVQGGGWETLCEVITTAGRKRPRRKFSELAFRRLGEKRAAMLLTPEETPAELNKEDTVQ